MAAFLKQLLRMFFAMEACGILYVLFIGHGLLHPQDASLGPWPYLVGGMAFALYATAFWTTRKPLLRPGAPAIIACLCNLGFASVYLFHTQHTNRSPLTLNITLAAI